MSEILVGLVGHDQNLFSPNTMSFDERKTELEKQDKAEEDQRKREKQSPYRNWYQFNLDHNRDMIWLARHAPKAHLILLFLLEQMDGYNAVMCSYQVFCDALDIGRTTASQAVKTLKEKGFIAVLKSGTSNVYIVNNDLAWKSWGKNKQYCKFPANVILSAAENTDFSATASTKIKVLEQTD